MALATMENGLMGVSKERVYIHGLMVITIKGLIKMDKKVDRVKCTGKMTINLLQDLGLKVNLFQLPKFQ